MAQVLAMSEGWRRRLWGPGAAGPAKPGPTV